jgi:hypothetical protein
VGVSRLRLSLKLRRFLAQRLAGVGLRQLERFPEARVPELGERTQGFEAHAVGLRAIRQKVECARRTRFDSELSRGP